MRRFAIISILSDQAKMRSGDNDVRFCHITQPSCKKMTAQMFDNRKDQHTHPCDIRWDPVVSSHLIISPQRLNETNAKIFLKGGNTMLRLIYSWTKKAICKIGARRGITGMWTVAIVLILCPDDSQCVVCVFFFFNIYFGFICVRL